MHERLDEFKFRQDPITDYRISCPCASGNSMYNVVNTLATSFLLNVIKVRFAGNEDNYKVWTKF